MKIQEGVLCLTHLEKLFDQRHRVDQGKYVWGEQILVSHEQAHGHCKGDHVNLFFFQKERRSRSVFQLLQLLKCNNESTIQNK